MLYKNISYPISHFFVALFMYLFVARRFSKPKTAVICAVSFLAITLPNTLKLNVFPDSRLCYLLVTVYQIAMTQLTGVFISKKRGSRALFVSLSASNYVIAGSVVAAVLHIFTKNIFLSILGCVATHVLILCILYGKIHDIWISYQESELTNGWGKLCLIPVFFYCGFSCLTFFPFTLDDHPENVPGVLMFMIAMFLSYIIVMRFVSGEARKTEIHWRNILYEHYIGELERRYYLVERSEKNLRILRHDMRHYSGMIDSMLDRGAYDEIRNVTKHINTVADENKLTKYCDNLVINMMLSSVMEQADTLGIGVRRDIVIPKDIPIDSYEFAMVIANLFDNAFDCVKDLSSDEKRVYAKIRCEDEYLLICIKNRYEKEIMFDEKTELPRSQRGKGHGFGMQSVHAFSDKLGGNISCYCEDGMFNIILFAKFPCAPGTSEQ